MKCNTCIAEQRPLSGSPAPGFCDSCGWALAEGGERIVPARALMTMDIAVTPSRTYGCTERMGDELYRREDG
jgi:hypothetical protein